MKIKLKEEPWYIVQCSIKIKLYRSVTSTADYSNSGYMQAYGTRSLKTLRSLLFYTVVLSSRIDVGLFEYRSISDGILRYKLKQTLSQAYVA